ncbi:hypothetical protein HYPSUDRAFT_203813 [Hypholoma sublateritium FD-334 SS-4]|uniref:Uncharacterized protein n=1 Tax=Hypholoma sublateritium (strain FD-334 SS-4) TaxID=945553 RepID=A0A0D2L0W7_HYPSF|nr:hypothetical protein HYPSUDRAFT_203813 [Hypholoma sublateritium FD-334 SS-4]
MVPEWPAPLLVQEIVDKSSNQFIYASVVIKFISPPCIHPVQQLEIIRGLQPTGELMPFAQLDVLYQHIFSQVHDITRVTGILAVAILSKFRSKGYICLMLDIVEDDIVAALADLTSVVSYQESEITFLHSSLPDFLLDQLRAQQYYIDRGVWCKKLALTYLSKRIYGELLLLLTQARCTPQLRKAVFTLDSSNFSSLILETQFIPYISTVRNMDFGDGGEVYRHQLNWVVHHIHQDILAIMLLLEDNHDITEIMDKIVEEKVAAGEKNELPSEIGNSPGKASFWFRLRRYPAPLLSISGCITIEPPTTSPRLVPRIRTTLSLHPPHPPHPPLRHPKVSRLPPRAVCLRPSLTSSPTSHEASQPLDTITTDAHTRFRPLLFPPYHFPLSPYSGVSACPYDAPGHPSLRSLILSSPDLKYKFQ